jgi:hypothetical protein
VANFALWSQRQTSVAADLYVGDFPSCSSRTQSSSDSTPSSSMAPSDFWVARLDIFHRASGSSSSSSSGAGHCPAAGRLRTCAVCVDADGPVEGYSGELAGTFVEHFEGASLDTKYLDSNSKEVYRNLIWKASGGNCGIPRPGNRFGKQSRKRY